MRDIGIGPELVADEFDLISRAISVENSDILDIGCGDGAMARRLAGAGARVIGIEVDVADVERAARASADAGTQIRFAVGRAEALRFSDDAFDAVVMLKSLHHVPPPLMRRALGEVARVLRPGGLLYVSEPVFAGPFNDIMRIFHDEQAERAAALAAMHEAAAEGTLELVDERLFLSPVRFADFADFDRRMLSLPTLRQPVTEEIRAKVLAAWERIALPREGRFERPMRITLMRSPPA